MKADSQIQPPLQHLNTRPNPQHIILHPRLHFHPAALLPVSQRQYPLPPPPPPPLIPLLPTIRNTHYTPPFRTHTNLHMGRLYFPDLSTQHQNHQQPPLRLRQPREPHPQPHPHSNSRRHHLPNPRKPSLPRRQKHPPPLTRPPLKILAMVLPSLGRTRLSRNIQTPSITPSTSTIPRQNHRSKDIILRRYTTSTNPLTSRNHHKSRARNIPPRPNNQPRLRAHDITLQSSQQAAEREYSGFMRCAG